LPKQKKGWVAIKNGEKEKKLHILELQIAEKRGLLPSQPK
jgi:hypothetical protein